MSPFVLNVGLVLLPWAVVGALTWRVVWPRWKLALKLPVHAIVYVVLAFYLGHWSVPIAWLHQGLGLAGHIWFSRRHGFTWYAVEDPAEYVRLSKAMVGAADAEGESVG